MLGLLVCIPITASCAETKSYKTEDANGNVGNYKAPFKFSGDVRSVDIKLGPN